MPGYYSIGVNFGTSNEQPIINPKIATIIIIFRVTLYAGLSPLDGYTLTIITAPMLKINHARIFQR
jgi:hypothetical protein